MQNQPKAPLLKLFEERMLQFKLYGRILCLTVSAIKFLSDINKIADLSSSCISCKCFPALDFYAVSFSL